MKWLGITAICAVVLAVLAAGLGVALWWSNHSAANLAVKEQAVAANAVVASGQAQAQTNAIQVVVAGQARDRIDVEVHQHNDAAISAAPGAEAAIDTALNDVGRAGLCAHAAYRDDPECAPGDAPASNGAHPW